MDSGGKRDGGSEAGGPDGGAPAGGTKPAPGPGRRRGLPGWASRHPVLLSLVLGLLLGLLAVLGYGVRKVHTWPEVARLATENPETTAFIQRWRDRHGDEPAWRWVPYDRISPHLKHAVVVAEDIDFFSHEGFDADEIESALRRAWEEKRFPRGASTLTQQVAKNLWLSPSRNPLRKVEEALLTRELEEHLSKRRILEIYLNVAELGDGIYGAEAAARHYFGLPASALGRRQAAQLAASLPRPKTWHPGVDSRAYRRRVEMILGRMEESDWVRREL